MDPSIRDFQKGKVDYVANALEHPLLLSQDMANLRTLKKHEVFLTLKSDLAMVYFLNYPLYCNIYIYILLEKFTLLLFPRLSKQQILLKSGWMMPMLS